MTRPQRKKSGEGMPSVGNWATRVKMRTNIPVVRSGCRMNQIGPRIVCLYRATKSRWMSK